MTGTESPLQRIDTSKPHPARVYDWLLGGKDNYPVDEELGLQLMASDGTAQQVARSNRSWMHRVTRWLTQEAGIRQYLDIGTGIPTEPNLHQIAQATARDTRIVYVDNDPIVLAHAGALLRGTPEGVTEYIQADARDTDTILEQAARVLDFDRPIALSLVALLHFIPDDDGAYELVGTLVDALPAGSYVALSMMTADYNRENVERGVRMYAAGGLTLVPRPHADAARFFKGLELVEPGVVSLSEWHPEPTDSGTSPGDGPVPLYGGVALKAS
ncbi:SAM-dependent methyltransferase [Streptomyces sp. 2A115]|uniref:SAM-dependent methyltransferase n=1 Tax=Streptomyces sp. 2A115 TaxID=3457439 RepID=UPI003FD13685